MIQLLLLLILKSINIIIIININNINAKKNKNDNRYQQLPQYVINQYNNFHLIINIPIINTNSKSFKLILMIITMYYKNYS